jgi:hypothetical protein
MKLPKFSQHGIAHILAPIAFIGVFAAIGGVALYVSHADTINSNVSCNASAPSQVVWDKPYNVGMSIKNNKNVYFTPRVAYQVVDYYQSGSTVQDGSYVGMWDKIAPGQSESTTYQKVLTKPFVKKAVHFQVYWGDSTTAAAVCSASSILWTPGPGTL